VRSPVELADTFRASGLRITPQRERIFSLLYRNESHPSARDVFAEARKVMPTMALKTVYQTLNDLVAMGEIRRLDLGTGAARFDPNADAPHHLVCLGCGVVCCLYADLAVEVPPGEHHGFAVRDTEVVFRGLCPECAAPYSTV
jgi:Fe2+ or Zn2+ uptake regulation protein